MAALIAFAIPAGVWLANGYLPVPAIILGVTLGAAFWVRRRYLRP